MIRDFRTLFEEEKDYYKPNIVSNFWNNNYIEFESTGDRNKNLSLEEYLNKNKPYLWEKIIDLQESDAWKIHLTIAINSISSKDPEEKRVMHSKSYNLKFMSYNDANKVFVTSFKISRQFRKIHERTYIYF